MKQGKEERRTIKKPVLTERQENSERGNEFTNNSINIIISLFSLLKYNPWRYRL
jgi:hypothetical protein